MISFTFNLSTDVSERAIQEITKYVLISLAVYLHLKMKDEH